MNLLLIPAAAFILLGIAFSALFARLVSRDRVNRFPDDSDEIFSLARYRAMDRLLSEEDQNFLRMQPGWNRRKEKNFRKARIGILREYVHQLAADFNKICKAIKLLMVTSEVDRPDLAGLLMKQKFLFVVGMISVEFKLTLYGFGWRSVDVQDLMRTLQTMRSHVQSFAALLRPPRRKYTASHASHERWLVSYADFITLLFAFFVVMFASAQTDKAKTKQVSDSVREALENGGVTAAIEQILGGTVNQKGQGNAKIRGPGGPEKTGQQREVKGSVPAQAELLPPLQLLSQELQEEIKSGKVQVRLEPRGLVISLLQAAFFPSGGDTLDPNSFPSIAKVAAVLRDLPNPVRLEGYTDSVPIHTPRFGNNWELSVARSITMLDVLSSRCEIPAERFAVAGYADTAPVASNDTEEGRARNRRVDIVILNRLMTADSSPKTVTAKGG